MGFLKYLWGSFGILKHCKAFFGGILNSGGASPNNDDLVQL